MFKYFTNDLKISKDQDKASKPKSTLNDQIRNSFQPKNYPMSKFTKGH